MKIVLSVLVFCLYLPMTVLKVASVVLSPFVPTTECIDWANTSSSTAIITVVKLYSYYSGRSTLKTVENVLNIFYKKVYFF